MIKPVDLDEIEKSLEQYQLTGLSPTASEVRIKSMIHELRLRRQIPLYQKGKVFPLCVICQAGGDYLGHKTDCPVKALEEMEGSDE